MKKLLFLMTFLLSFCAYSDTIYSLGASDSLSVPIKSPKPTTAEEKINEPAGTGLPKFDIDTYNLDKNKYLNEYLSNNATADGKVFKVRRSVEFLDNWLGIQFYQLDDGARFSRINTIEIDIETSIVTELNLHTFPSVSEKFEKQSLISENKAYELAYHVFVTQIPHLVGRKLLKDEIFVNSSSEPYIHYSVSNYVVEVNLVTGDTSFWSISLRVEYPTDKALNGHADVKNNVCKTIDLFPNAVACTKVYSETTEEIGFPAIIEYIEAGKSYMHCLDTNGPAPGGHGPICQDMSNSDKAMIDAWVYLNEWEKDTDGYTSSTDNSDFPQIDIVAYSNAKDANGNPRADYSPPRKGIPNGNIVLPKKGVHPGFKSDVDPLKNRELIIHEAAHSETAYLNPNFGSPEYPVLQAIGEAISDLKAIRTPGQHQMPVDTWVFGKTLFKDGYVRDMRINRTFGEFDAVESPHSNSTIFSHYFFALAHKEGMSNQKLLQLITVLPYTIAKKYPEIDISTGQFATAVKETLVQIKLEELQQAADEVLSQMNDPSGEYPEMPHPIIGIFGDYIGCDGNIGQATLRWINSEDAEYFKIYGMEPNKTWEYKGTTDKTHQDVIIRTHAYGDWRVDACNEAGYCAVSGATWRQVNQCNGWTNRQKHVYGDENNLIGSSHVRRY